MRGSLLNRRVVLCLKLFVELPQILQLETLVVYFFFFGRKIARLANPDANLDLTHFGECLPLSTITAGGILESICKIALFCSSK